MLNMESNRNNNNEPTSKSSSNTRKQLEVTFNSTYCEKWISITQIKDMLLFNTLWENIRLLESIIKEFWANWPLVVFKVPLNQKLSKGIVNCILEENIDDCFITIKEHTFLNTLKSQFPDDYYGLKALFKACQNINKPLKQRYDVSWKWFWTELYF